MGVERRTRVSLVWFEAPRIDLRANVRLAEAVLGTSSRADVFDPSIGPAFYVEAKQYSDGAGIESGLRAAFRQALDTVGNLPGTDYGLDEAFIVLFRRGGPRAVLPVEHITAEGLRWHFVLINIAEPSVDASKNARPRRSTRPTSCAPSCSRSGVSRRRRRPPIPRPPATRADHPAVLQLSAKSAKVKQHPTLRPPVESTQAMSSRAACPGEDTRRRNDRRVCSTRRLVVTPGAAISGVSASHLASNLVDRKSFSELSLAPLSKDSRRPLHVRTGLIVRLGMLGHELPDLFGIELGGVRADVSGDLVGHHCISSFRTG